MALQTSGFELHGWHSLNELGQRAGHMGFEQGQSLL
jgi:hypothetical protein